MNARRLVAPGLAGLVWLALWGDISWANVFSGLVAVTITFLVFPVAKPTHRFHPVGGLRFVGDFLGRLWSSSVTVALACVAPTPERLNTGTIEFPLGSSSPLVATMLANSISLTPGTLTLDVLEAPPRLLVHVMGLGDAAAVLDDLRSLERRVLDAFEPLGPDPAEPSAESPAEGSTP